MVDRIEDSYAGEITVVRLKDGNPAHNGTLEQLRVVGHPVIVLLDGSGEERDRLLGPQSFEDLRPKVESLVAP